MISYTTFLHPHTIAKIDAAMRVSVSKSLSSKVRVGVATIRNKRGLVVGLVEHRRGSHCESGFRFWWQGEYTASYCTNQVLKALRHYTNQ